jgi:hypothetical protein
MAWGTEQSDTQQTAINNTTEEFGGTITLLPGELLSGYVLADNEHASTVTDALRISFYISTDDGTTWSEEPILRFTYLPPTVSVNRVPVSVSGHKTIRIGYLSTGATNTYTAQLKYKLDGVSL